MKKTKLVIFYILISITLLISGFVIGFNAIDSFIPIMELSNSVIPAIGNSIVLSAFSLACFAGLFHILFILKKVANGSEREIDSGRI
jgi:cytochrome b subunit of formate dehydrogenase